MRVEHAERPGGEHEEPGHREEHAHGAHRGVEVDRRWTPVATRRVSSGDASAPIAVAAAAKSMRKPSAGARRTATTSRPLPRGAEARVHRDERGRERSFAEEVLRDVPDPERGGDRVGERREAEVVADEGARARGRRPARGGSPPSRGFAERLRARRPRGQQMPGPPGGAPTMSRRFSKRPGQIVGRGPEHQLARVVLSGHGRRCFYQTQAESWQKIAATQPHVAVRACGASPSTSRCVTWNHAKSEQLLRPSFRSG